MFVIIESIFTLVAIGSFFTNDLIANIMHAVAIIGDIKI